MYLEMIYKIFRNQPIYILFFCEMTFLARLRTLISQFTNQMGSFEIFTKFNFKCFLQNLKGSPQNSQFKFG
jgi:hypothetical protein